MPAPQISPAARQGYRSSTAAHALHPHNTSATAAATIAAATTTHTTALPPITPNHYTATAARHPAGKAAAKGKGAARGARPLNRPIICICNDLYAPALRPLREAAHVLHMRPPPTARLLARLQHICAWEGLGAQKQVGVGRGAAWLVCLLWLAAVSVC
jgi:hypothetical protein